jgi:hypothetical protein
MINVKNKRVAYAVVAVVAAAALCYVLFLRGSGTSALTKFDDQQVNSTVMSQLYAIANNETLANKIGIGTSAANLPQMVYGTPISYGGKPEIVYVSSDFCPYCAITRWGFIIALMRFGNFTSLHYMTSSATDIYANSATFTFYNASYSSALLSLVAAEASTNNGDPLMTLNSIENATYNKYDVYTEYKGSIPFIDFANESVQIGASVTPQVIKGMDWGEVISMMRNASSPVAQAIIGNANVFTAYICASNASLQADAVCHQGYVAKVKSLR